MNTIYDYLQKSPSFKSELCSCGVLSDTDAKSEIPARLFSVETFLKTHKVDFRKLSGETIQYIRDTVPDSHKRLHLLALLPCGLRNAFKEAFIREFPEYAEEDNDDILIEGNLNYEKVFYQYIDSLAKAEELPDIFITSDFNSLYHRYFTNHFLNEQYFEKLSLPMHPLFEGVGYGHTEDLFSMLTANVLVMVADEDKWEKDKLPNTWAGLLNPVLQKSIVLRGDNDFFCNAVFYPFYKQGGEEAIVQLATNTLRGMHPSEMVKAISSGNTGEATVFVMPYSFAIKIRNMHRFRLLWPEDGAIVSPVQMLVKKGSYEKYKREIDFIAGKTMGEALEQLGFPSSNIQTSKNYPGESLNWIGWDFLASHDMSEIKQRIQQVFFDRYKACKV
jgi:ABC-type Fe3+ transport system substrate-binding protein